jgi:tetratricopeptide (TPR) repeat protein
VKGLTEETLSEARQFFIEGQYKLAEPLLEQLLLQNLRNPEIYQMLATIYYDRGQFNKAIKTFKRALEIDPQYTDASVGLSIILNDLGRYDEGRKIFQEARQILDNQKKPNLSFLDETISKKHEEIADLYSQSRAWSEALENLQKALKLTPQRRVQLGLKLAEAHSRLGESQKAIRELREVLFIDSECVSARLKLAELYQRTNRLVEARDQWESVLVTDPRNSEARENLQKLKSGSKSNLLDMK